MTGALREAGWAQLHAVPRPTTGCSSGTWRPTTIAAARQRMAQTDVNARWQAEMQPLFR